MDIFDRLTGPLVARWYRRAKERAWGDPVWAEIETRRRDTGDSHTTYFISEAHGLGMDELDTQRETWARLNPPPWWRRLEWWLLRHELRHPVDRCLGWVQRASKGYSRLDLHSFDSYLAGVIASGIDEIRAQAQGHPTELTAAEWDDVLRRISVGFRAWVEDGERVIVKGEPDVAEALGLFERWFTSLWD